MRPILELLLYRKIGIQYQCRSLKWKENYVTGAELDQAAAKVRANKRIPHPTMRIPPSLKSFEIFVSKCVIILFPYSISLEFPALACEAIKCARSQEYNMVNAIPYSRNALSKTPPSQPSYGYQLLFFSAWN